MVCPPLHFGEVTQEKLPERADLRLPELPFRQVSTAEITDTVCLLTDHRDWRQETEGHAPGTVFQRVMSGGRVFWKLEILEFFVFFSCACASACSLSFEHKCLLVCLSQEEVLVKVPEQGAATQHGQYLPSTHTCGTALHLALPGVHIFRFYSLAVKLK